MSESVADREMRLENFFNLILCYNSSVTNYKEDSKTYSMLLKIRKKWRSALVLPKVIWSLLNELWYLNC